MDSKVEDKMVRQIEKNLSNNINENLFLTGRIFEKDTKVNQTSIAESPNSMSHTTETPMDYSANSYEYSNQNQPQSILSRAEYIRQARESCLRQLSAMSAGSSTYNTIYPDADPLNEDILGRKKPKVAKQFHEETIVEGEYREVNTPQEIAAFRFLIIRMVCAIVLFLTIFLFDKFDFKVGTFTSEVIQEYVTGNDSMQDLENMLVTWLK
ncbi:MAG: putative rane protein [Herbinix sp.]|jgi:hypothetical protein|nr:putative rane protein [Herbinix sp.]